MKFHFESNQIPYRAFKNIFKLINKKTNVFNVLFQILNICSQIFILKSLRFDSFQKNKFSSQRSFMKLIYFKFCSSDLNFIFCLNSLVQTNQRVYFHNYRITFKSKYFLYQQRKRSVANLFRYICSTIPEVVSSLFSQKIA